MDINQEGLLPAVLTGIGTLIISLTKNTEMGEAFIKFLAKRLKRVDVIDFDDLNKHDYILKLIKLADSDYYHLPIVIENKAKEDLYFKYVKIVATVSLSTARTYLAKEHLKLDEQGLKAFVYKSFTNQFNEYDTQLSQLLISINNDKEAVNLIIYKIRMWRLVETQLLLDNVTAIISSGKVNVPYKFDTLFSVYSLGMDMLLKNSVESFNRLNGELDDFLINKTKK